MGQPRDKGAVIVPKSSTKSDIEGFLAKLPLASEARRGRPSAMPLRDLGTPDFGSFLTVFPPQSQVAIFQCPGFFARRRLRLLQFAASAGTAGSRSSSYARHSSKQ